MPTNASKSYTQQAQKAVNRTVLEESPVLSAVISIHAERQRVFQAITLPEYLEAWLTGPGALPGSAVVTAGQNSFWICCAGAKDEHFRIFGSYKACKRSRLLLDWKYEEPSAVSISLVSIRLLGDFERTTLELVHLGLPEFLISWHRELWDASLANLSRLF